LSPLSVTLIVVYHRNMLHPTHLGSHYCNKQTRCYLKNISYTIFTLLRSNNVIKIYVNNKNSSAPFFTAKANISRGTNSLLLVSWTHWYSVLLRYCKLLLDGHYVISNRLVYSRQYFHYSSLSTLGISYWKMKKYLTNNIEPNQAAHTGHWPGFILVAKTVDFQPKHLKAKCW
jgi:hypothetical protein